jgi:putative protease
MPARNRPELLAPAGQWDCARAAVANGADAVYFGLPAFNARMRADNFSEDDLEPLVRFLHAHGVRAYLTLNILVFTDELPEAERFLRAAARAGVDAVLVQDLGVVRLAREVAPQLEIHASTQMTITSPEGVRFARSLGVARVVLAREVSLRELAKFRRDDPGMLPVETFVHGALCIAYSGQCLTSESLGQRSANRGECAQACRLPYDLVIDGTVRGLGGRRYLLSPRDLAAVGDVPALIEAGVASFKIEGRLKSPEYVAASTRAYRKAIDAALGAGGAAGVSPEDRYQLEMAFSRGFHSGWLHGVDHQALVDGRFGTKRGPFAGFVRRAGPDFVEFAPRTRLAPGDGIAFDTGGNPDDEQGGRIYEIRGERFFFRHGKIDFSRIAPGHRVWKTSDPALERELRRTFADLPAESGRPVVFEAEGRLGSPLRLTVRCGGVSAVAESDRPLQAARNRALDEAVLREQLGRLGGTAFAFGELACRVEAGVFLPVREINELRRRCLGALAAALAARGAAGAPAGAQAESPLHRMLGAVASRRGPPEPGPAALAVLCRTMEHVAAALECGVESVYVDFEDLRRCPDAVALCRTRPGASVFLATPRIQKAGEQGFFRSIEDAAPDGVLIRNLGGLEHFQGSSLRAVGDFSLNAANPLSAALLMERGLERLTISYDLDHAQVEHLLEAAPPAWFELTIHQHMPMFHMEHCVVAAFLSAGHSHLDCGRPCERHDVRIRDRLGFDHPVKADVGCRNTVYHAQAQSGAAFFDGFFARGLRRVRVELVDEDAVRARGLITAYQALLRGEISAAALLARLQPISRLGVVSGTLAVKR